MKLLSWNIAGGHTFSKTTSDALSYDQEDFPYFRGQLAQIQADVICLQEQHLTQTGSQAQQIAQKLRYAFLKEHGYGNSHIKAGNGLALGNISMFEIINSEYHILPNPHLTVTRENGDQWVTFDVGFLITEILYKEQKVNIANCHLVPFHYFKRDFLEPEFAPIREDIEALLLALAEKPSIIAGDFNFSNLNILLPNTFARQDYKEVFEGETTVGKGQQDHILYSSHWNLEKYEIIKTKSDHYACVAELSL